ncbi:MAG TPA: hypothetical protein VIP05_11135 [Burkholderiaceae bacterium]
MTDPQRPPGATPTRDSPVPAERPPHGLDAERPDGPPLSPQAQKDMREQQRAAGGDARSDG